MSQRLHGFYAVFAYVWNSLGYLPIRLCTSRDDFDIRNACVNCQAGFYLSRSSV